MATNGSIARYKNDNKHQTRSMHGTSSSITNTYTLNVDKALKKKLDATKRQQNVLYEYTRGGLVITADAATFELLKIAANIYYENLPESLGKAYITQSTDSTQRNNVQTTIRVHEQEQPAYTVNLYLTSSRILVNGKNLTLFVERDITGIHDIIHAATYNGNQINLNKLNNILAEQLQHIIGTNTTTTSGHKLRKTPATKQHEIEDISCSKCRKNCRTRSIYCTEGEHWIHYKCEKLNSEQITAIEATTAVDYKCTLCQNGKSNNCTNAVAILDECNLRSDEVQDETRCNLCDKAIDDENYDLCTSCNNTYHLTCMETNNDHKTCYSCKSYIDELENQNESEITQPELDEHNTILKETSSNNNRCTDAIQTQSQNILNENHCIDADKHETSPKRLLLPSSITKSHDEESISAKLRELRKKETKLKKLEETLKIREKSLTEQRKSRIEMETYCNKLEAKNTELELMVKTLQRSIEQHEQSSDNPSMSTVNATTNLDINSRMKEQFNNKILAVHDKITNMVFDQIEKQLELVNTSMNSTSQTTNQNSSDCFKTTIKMSTARDNMPKWNNQSTTTNHDNSLINNFQDTCTSQTIQEVKTLHIITPELATGIPLYYKQRSSSNVAKPSHPPQQQTRAYRTPIVQDRGNYGPAIKDNTDRVNANSPFLGKTCLQQQLR